MKKFVIAAVWTLLCGLPLTAQTVGTNGAQQVTQPLSPIGVTDTAAAEAATVPARSGELPLQRLAVSTGLLFDMVVREVTLFKVDFGHVDVEYALNCNMSLGYHLFDCEVGYSHLLFFRYYLYPHGDPLLRGLWLDAGAGPVFYDEYDEGTGEYSDKVNFNAQIRAGYKFMPFRFGLFMELYAGADYSPVYSLIPICSFHVGYAFSTVPVIQARRAEFTRRQAGITDAGWRRHRFVLALNFPAEAVRSAINPDGSMLYQDFSAEWSLGRDASLVFKFPFLNFFNYLSVTSNTVSTNQYDAMIPSVLFRYYFFPRDELMRGLWVESGLGLELIRTASTVLNPQDKNILIRFDFQVNAGYQFVLGLKKRFVLEPWIGAGYSGLGFWRVNYGASVGMAFGEDTVGTNSRGRKYSLDVTFNPALLGLERLANFQIEFGLNRCWSVVTAGYFSFGASGGGWLEQEFRLEGEQSGVGWFVPVLVRYYAFRPTSKIDGGFWIEAGGGPAAADYSAVPNFAGNFDCGYKLAVHRSIDLVFELWVGRVCLFANDIYSFNEQGIGGLNVGFGI